jgi:hypothetical protein
VKLVVVVLELLFLKKDNLCRLWDIDTDSAQALGFTDESEDFTVEVHVQLDRALFVSHNEGSLETSFGLFNLKLPLLAPKVLVREKSVADPVVLLDRALVVLVLRVLWWELLHGDRDPVEKVARPSDRAGNSG